MLTDVQILYMLQYLDITSKVRIAAMFVNSYLRIILHSYCVLLFIVRLPIEFDMSGVNGYA